MKLKRNQDYKWHPLMHISLEFPWLFDLLASFYKRREIKAIKINLSIISMYVNKCIDKIKKFKRNRDHKITFIAWWRFYSNFLNDKRLGFIL